MKHSLFTFTKVLSLLLTVAMLIGSGCDAYGQRGRKSGKKILYGPWRQINVKHHSLDEANHHSLNKKTQGEEWHNSLKKWADLKKDITTISSSPVDKKLKDVFQNPWNSVILDQSQVFHPDYYLGDDERNQQMLDSCLSLHPNKKEWFIRQMNACIRDSVELSYEEIMDRRFSAIKDTGLRQVQRYYWHFGERNMFGDGRLVIVRRLGPDNDNWYELEEQIDGILNAAHKLQPRHEFQDSNFEVDYAGYSTSNLRIQPISENDVWFMFDCEEAIAEGVILPLREISDAIYDYRHKKHEAQK